MSYDLFVASEKRPDLTLLAPQFNSWPDVQSAEVMGEQIVIRPRLANTTEAVFLLGPSARCEAEDLDDQILAYVKRPQWLTEFTISAHAIGAVDLARRVAISIAEATSGAAFDPQEDGVFWPPHRRHALRPQQQQQRIDIISLNWIVALPSDATLRMTASPEACRRFLDIIARTQPAANPVRCGSYEPLQGKGIPDFEREWRQAAEPLTGGSLSFTAKPPYLGGDVSFVYPRHSLESPKHSLSCIEISLDIDASVIADDSAERALLIDFAKIADHLQAIYGSVFYLRGYERVRGQLMVPQGADPRPHLLGNGWIGLPPVPAWVVWMHNTYADELEGEAIANVTSALQHGRAFLLAKRGASAPMPGVPRDLLTRPGHIPHGAATRIPPYERFITGE